MTMWMPNLEGRKGKPVYRAIADTIFDDMRQEEEIGRDCPESGHPLF